ncbi:MAG: hypothetical protein Q4C91_17635 [Eubacteriales bacterium]|nr:hypothetical protein [Eubacteriales bacterium]
MGTCPKLSQIPTSTPSYPYYGNNNSTGSGSSGYGSSGTGTSYGYSSGGSYAGSAKTGDERPFRTMARVGFLGLILLGCGVWLYRKSRKPGDQA